MIIPTGGCDVSARNVTVTLPEYPGSTAVPLTVRCGQNQKIGFYLSGTTADSANTVFTNTSSASPAQGIGVQLLRNGTILRSNSTVSMGTVGTSAVNPTHRNLCAYQRPGHRGQRAIHYWGDLCLPVTRQRRVIEREWTIFFRPARWSPMD